MCGAKTHSNQGYEMPEAMLRWMHSHKVVERIPFQDKRKRDVSGVMGVCVCRMLSNAHLNNEYESECAGGVSGHVVPM